MHSDVFKLEEPGRPTFFERFAERQLCDALKPALDYVLAILGARTWTAARLSVRSDEFFALIMLALNVHHLRRHNATFTEHFYGLSRQSRNGAALSGTKKLLSVLSTVFVPYLYSKAQAHFEHVHEAALSAELEAEHRLDMGDVDAARTSPTERTVTFNDYYRRFFPWFRFVAQTIRFVLAILYVYGRVDAYTLEEVALGVRLHRPPPDIIEAEHVRLSLERKRLLQQCLRTLAVDPVRGVVHGVSLAVETAAHYTRLVLPSLLFAYQFAEWWYSNEERLIVDDADVPPPPLPPPGVGATSRTPLPGCVAYSAVRGQCALCRRTRQGSAASSGGVAFCYTCLFDWVREHGYCPVTRLPMSTKEIRRLYTQ